MPFLATSGGRVTLTGGSDFQHCVSYFYSDINNALIAPCLSGAWDRRIAASLNATHTVGAREDA